jgi:hypothetical protein
MEELQAQKEAVINPALKSLLKRNGIENPSIEFTQSVIESICLYQLLYVRYI